MSRISTTSVASGYPHDVMKIERGRTTAELHQVIERLTGFDEAALQEHLASGTTFEQLFAAARLHRDDSTITGTVCGVRRGGRGPAGAQDPLPGRARRGLVGGEGPAQPGERGRPPAGVGPDLPRPGP